MVRVSVRRVGSLTGKLAAAPESLAALLALATKKLKLDKPASHIFTASGDEFDDNDDVLLLREDEVVYVSCGEDFSRGRSVGPALRALGARKSRLVGGVFRALCKSSVGD